MHNLSVTTGKETEEHSTEPADQSHEDRERP